MAKMLVGGLHRSGPAPGAAPYPLGMAYTVLGCDQQEQEEVGSADRRRAYSQRPAPDASHRWLSSVVIPTVRLLTTAEPRTLAGASCNPANGSSHSKGCVGFRDDRSGTYW
jgi:hypothetical protein